LTGYQKGEPIQSWPHMITETTVNKIPWDR